MAKKKRQRRNAKAEITKKKPVDKKTMYANLGRLGCLIAVTAVIFLLYRVLINQYFFQTVMIVYMVVAAVAIFTYVIYNRGFSRRGLTSEMLPDTMTAEEKEEFIEDGNRRLKRSRPLLMVIFAFAFTFIYDAVELIAVPFFKGLFS